MSAEHRPRVRASRSRIVAWVWAASIAAGGVRVGVALVAGDLLNAEGAVYILLVPAYAGLGLLMAIRRPGNRVAWLLLFVSSYIVGQGFIEARLVDLSVPPDPVALRHVLWIAWVNAGFFFGLLFPLFLFFYIFPTGRFLNRRWSWSGWVAALTSVAAFVISGFNEEIGPDGEDWTVANPFGFIDGIGLDDGGPISWLFGIGFFALAVGAIPAIVVRYRRADALVRTQIKWVVFALIIGAVGFIASILLGASIPDWASTALFLVMLVAIPVSITIAITRYRLFDIDVVISRTVVLAILAGFITATYALVVVGLGQLIGGESDGLLLPIGATALVAVAFEPVRLRAQSWANRLVFGKRASPYEVVSDLTERLSGAEESEGILSRMAELLRDGTGAERASVWLGEEDSMVNAATAPRGATPSATVDLAEDVNFTVTHAGDVVGALEVVKPRGTQLSSSERSLIADLAGSAGAVLGYQRLNDSLSQRASELEQSRTRLLGVQDAERRRLEQDLHEGAEQFIVALKVKMGVASQLAARAGNEKLENLLSDLTDEAQTALDDVQSLAKGIYPPVLEAEGLGAAVSALANAAPVEVHVESDGVARHPAEIEAAVYFGISEAVTNAVKHAKPPVRIDLMEEDGVLKFSVIDDGPGFDIDQSDMGSGLENMADRIQAVGGTLEVTSATGARTEVSGAIPV